MQQLDLFGNIIPSSPPKKKDLPAEAKPVSKDNIKKTPSENVNEESIKPGLSGQLRKKPQVIEIIEPIVVNNAFEEEKDLPLTEQNVEITAITIYDEVKRKRGRPRKEKPLIAIPKIKQKRGRKSFAEVATNLDLIDIPNDEELDKKQYYPISTVAKWFNVNNSQIRLWENQFEILKPKKNGKGDRLFRPEDVRNLKVIHHLLRQRKFSVEGAKDYLKANQHKTTSDVQLKESLQNLKTFLLEIKASL